MPHDVDGEVAPSTPSKETMQLERQRSRRSTRKSTKETRVLKRKKEDMATKAKLAAEEANKLGTDGMYCGDFIKEVEYDEMMAKLHIAGEAAKEEEVAKVAGAFVSQYFERIVIYGMKDDMSLEAWGESTSMVYKSMTRFANEVGCIGKKTMMNRYTYRRCDISQYNFRILVYNISL